MRFRRLYCQDLQPFGELDLRFPAVENPQRGGEVHILTGVNGTGKTRLLAVLAAMLGNPEALKARATKDQSCIYPTVDQPDGKIVKLCRYPNPPLELGLEDPVLAFGFLGGNFQWANMPDGASKVPSFFYGGEAYLTAAPIKGNMEGVQPPDRASGLSFRKEVQSGSAALSQALYNLTIIAASDIRLSDSLEVAKQQSRPLRLLSRIEDTLRELTGKNFHLSRFRHRPLASS